MPTAGGQLTQFLGELAVCLDEQRTGAFWEAKDTLFNMAASGRYDGNSGRNLTQTLGLDYNRALECTRTSSQVLTDAQLGQTLGVTGTPAVMIRIDDAEPIWISAGGQQFSRGGVPFAVLASVVDSNS